MRFEPKFHFLFNIKDFINWNSQDMYFLELGLGPVSSYTEPIRMMTRDQK